jgi:hypothetical protein
MTIQGLEMQKAGLAAMQSAAGAASEPAADSSQQPSGGEGPAKK